MDESGLSSYWAVNASFLFSTLDTNTCYTYFHFMILKGLKNPLSLALDFITKELYWTDFQTKTIEKAHVTGTNQQTFLRGTRTVYPNQLVVIACQRYDFANHSL